MKSCGACTECCKGILNITINSIKYSDGNKCINCTKEGCKDYINRPKDCVNYNCGWLMDESMDKWMRPDKSKVFINDSTTDTVIYNNKKVPYIVPIGNNIDKKVMDYLIKRAIERNEPFRYIHKPNDSTVSIGAFGNASFKYFIKKLGLPEG